MSGTAINKNDARYLATQQLLEETFLKLLAEIGFQKMTVRGIVQEAGINRGTFYLHAMDKLDLLSQIEDRLYDGMMRGTAELKDGAGVNDTAKMQEIMTRSIRYVSDNKETVMMLMSDECDPLFFDRYAKRVRGLLFPATFGESVEAQYTMSLMSSIVGGFFNEWIKRSMKETPEEYIEIVMNISKKTGLLGLAESVIRV